MNKFLSKNNNSFYLSTTTNKNAARIMEAFGWKKINIQGLNKTSIIILNKNNFLKRIFFNKKIFFKNLIILIIGKILGILLKNNLTKWKNYQNNENIILYDRFDDRLDKFWTKYKKENNNKILINKNLLWLKWLLNSHLLTKKLKIFVIKEKKNISGYCIFIINKKNKINFAQILDIAVLKSHQKNNTVPLIKRCIEEANKNNCAFFEFRNTLNKNLDLMRDFRPLNIQLANNYFYFKTSSKNNNNIFTFQNWYLSSLDGDIVFNY